MYSRRLSISLITWAIAFSQPCVAKESSEDQIVLISFDSLGQASGHAIPVHLYQDSVATALKAVNKAMLPVLERRGEEAENSPVSWELNSVGVGLGLTFRVGLGPLIYLTINPQLRLVFSGSDNPIYPN
jgi:hypothetical protein